MPRNKHNTAQNSRLQFFRGLRMLVADTKCNEGPDKGNLHIATDKFRQQWNNMIWLELQAWQKATTVMEHDSWLVRTRYSKIPEIIERIKSFHFYSNLISTMITDNADLLQVTVVADPEEPKDFLRNSLFTLSNEYFETCFSAFKQVNSLLGELSFVEQLFSCTANLANDFPDFAVTQFQDKMDLVCMWYNTAFELLHNFSSIMEMLGLKEYKVLILSVILEASDEWHQSSDDSLPADDCEEDTDESIEDSDHDLLFCEAISKMTESYLRKHKVQNILSLLLRKHLGCLIRSHEMLERNYSFSEKWNRNPASGNISALTDAVKILLPEVDVSVPYVELPPARGYHGLPDLQPLYAFVQDFIFTIMGECLTLRLNQAQECQKQCGSTTSLLTVQQVVTECKEVIQCSLLALTFHLTLHLPAINTATHSPHEKLMSRFKATLKRMFFTYLDFVELWIIALLTGLPHAPRNFLDTLHSEWAFVKEASADINMMSCIPCSCKFVDICKQTFLTTQEFLDTASTAIFASKIANGSIIEDCLPPIEPVFEHRRSTRHYSSKSETPTSPQAGVLWFHRQRSESPHLARHHSVSYTHSDNLHTMVQASKSSPALLDTAAAESHRRYLFELCRAVRDLFEEVRERSIRAGNFARTLRKDLESAIEYNFTEDAPGGKKSVKKIVCHHCGILHKIQSSGFVKVDIAWTARKSPPQGFHPAEHMLFVTDDLYNPEQTLAKDGCDKLCKHLIISRIVSCFTSSPSEVARATSNGIFIIVKRKSSQSTNTDHHGYLEERHSSHKSQQQRCCHWAGPVIRIDQSDLMLNSIDLCDLMADDFILSHDVTAIAVDGQDNGRKRTRLSKLFGGFVKLEIAQSSVVRRVQGSLYQLQSVILSFSSALIQQIDAMGRLLQKQLAFDRCQEIEDEKQVFMEINRVVQKNFNIGFEFLNETTKVLSGPVRYKMEEIQLSYLKKWMGYVMEWLPRGKGCRPRWAGQGLNFLTTISPDVIKNLPDDDYNELKGFINNFIDHVVGTRPTSGKGVKPCDLEVEQSVYRSLSSNSRDGWDDQVCLEDKGDEEVMSFGASRPRDDDEDLHEMLPIDYVRFAIEELEDTIYQKKLADKVIGLVVDTPTNTQLTQLGIRSVNFQWQRGNKIGEGSFGRVYTCVNMDTGKILAMKEISFQPHDEQHIKAALDEITNFEGISHPNLVKYYGVEIHRDQMFIFMDFCDAGTLEEVSRVGLPEVMIQQYTAQLVLAVSVLHHQGFVHRDIKGSNIFLTSRGLLKLGDFGSAVRLLNRTKTLAGEVASHHGITPAFTAPEVINSVKQRGYGRSADIWSVGCVVIEMTTGKRPWHDLDPFQILYKVGMGSKPPVPPTLSLEGQSFVDHCLEVDPATRWDISALQSHPFVKVAQPDAAAMNGT